MVKLNDSNTELLLLGSSHFIKTPKNQLLSGISTLKMYLLFSILVITKCQWMYLFTKKCAAFHSLCLKLHRICIIKYLLRYVILWSISRDITTVQAFFLGQRWQSGNTLASHLWDQDTVPGPTSNGKAGSCLPLVGSLQYRTLTNCMYWFPLPFQLPVVIWLVQCWKRRKTPNK